MRRFLLIIPILSLLFVINVHSQSPYNSGTSSYLNQTWMGGLDFGVPIRNMSMLGTHVSVGFQFCLGTGGFQQTQSNSLQGQLNSGIRAIDIRVKHKNNMFQAFDRSCDLGVNFDTILTTVKTFLTAYPTETVLLHLIEEQSSSGCTQSFETTFISYRDKYAPLFWTPTSQDPLLGEVRGHILLLQDFTSTGVYGLLWATFTVLNHYKMGTNWDLYARWLLIKAFLPTANAAGKSQIQFWSGHGGSYPYFVVSGKSSMGGSCLATGLTTPGFKSSYPDFPRVACFIGICTICFNGMNYMGYNYIVSQGYSYTGIIYTDFYGDDLIKLAVGKNLANFPKCTATQVAQGCTFCQKVTLTCLQCNTLMGYVYDIATTKCLAQVGYYLDANYIPQSCPLAMPGCLECTSATVCTVCDTINNYLLSSSSCIAAPGYYLNASSFPVPCPQVGCAECSDEVNCTLCSEPNNYILNQTSGYTCMCDDLGFFMPATSVQACICMPNYFISSNNTCQLMPKCPDTSGGCLNCSGSVCLLCDTANHFEFDSTNTNCACAQQYYFDGVTCQSCATNDAACGVCVSPTLCLSCIANFTLITAKCQCLPNYYKVNPNTCNLCSVGCLTCTGIGACTTCDTANNFTLVSGYCQCISGMFNNNGTCQVCSAMAGCINCNDTGCTQCSAIFGFNLIGTNCECNYGFFINSMKVCQQCSMQGCLNCLSQPQCTQCNTTLYYLAPNNTCADVCGDGIRIYVQCDDGNIFNGDGCSSTCTVEKDFTCTGGSIISEDVCSYSGPFYLSVVKTSKALKKNQVFVQFIIQPNIYALRGIDFSVAITPVFPFTSKSAVFDPNTGIINFEFTYNTSLNALPSSQLGIDFDPPISQPAFYYMKSSKFYLPQETNNNLALKYYDDKIYNLLDLMNTLTQVTSFLYIGICLICFIFLSKLISIELILVPQIAFAGLIMIQRLQSLLQPLANLRYTNGYNPLFRDSILLPPRLSILFYYGQFLSNFNACIAVIILPLVIALIMLLIGKLKQSKKIMEYSYRSMKEWSFSVLLIFQFQFTISFGIDFLFGTGMIGKAIGGVLFAGILVLLALLYKKPLNFGQFKSYFKKSPLYLNHYIITSFFRVLLALDLIILSSNRLCGFVACGIAGLYTLYLIVVRPYENNVRPIINMVFTDAILAIETVYKLNYFSPDAEFITSYLPLFMVAGLLLLLLINVVFMLLEIKRKCTQGDKLKHYQQAEEESFDNELKKELERQMEVINTIQMALNASNLNKIKQKDPKQSGEQSSRILGLSELKQVQKDMYKSTILKGSPVELTKQEKQAYDQI